MYSTTTSAIQNSLGGNTCCLKPHETERKSQFDRGKGGSLAKQGPLGDSGETYHPAINLNF